MKIAMISEDGIKTAVGYRHAHYEELMRYLMKHRFVGKRMLVVKYFDPEADRQVGAA